MNSQKLKNLLLSIIEYAVCFFLYTWFTTPIHEWCHLTLLKWYGGDGYIIKTWYGAGVVFTKPPTNPTIVALAGGIGVAILYALIFYWDYYDGDWEEAGAVLPPLFSQLFYGIFEALYVYTMPFQEYLKWGGILTTAGWTIGFILGLTMLFKKLIKEM
jgi:hypothetical protein